MNRGNIRLVHGDILAAEAEALVNPVNCVGVMGKGLALQFKRAFPENYIAYYKACKEGLVKPGTVFVYSDPMHMLPHHIINFPTKRHWRDKSHMGDIALGLVSLVSEVRRLNIMSIAIPPLGVALGASSGAKYCLVYRKLLPMQNYQREWIYMKQRRHHNNTGYRQIKRGKTQDQVKKIAKKLGLLKALSPGIPTQSSRDFGRLA